MANQDGVNEQPKSTDPIIRGRLLYFDEGSGLLRLSVSPETDRTALRARFEKGETVTMEVVQPN